MSARFLFKRLLRMIGTIIGVTALAFFGIDLSISGGFQSVVVPAGTENSDRGRAAIAAFNLDDPLVVRYLKWLFDAAQGDFGRSIRNGDQVVDVLTHRLPITLQLTLGAIVLAVLVAVPLGIFTATRGQRSSGRIVTALAGLFQSIPVFMTATILITIFAVKLRWLPASGWTRISNSFWENIERSAMPTIALAFAEIGIIARVLNASLRSTFGEDYVAAARAKGLSTRYILFRHAWRPASLDVFTLIGLNIGALMAGAVVVEEIFGIGGLGRVLLEGSLARDQYVIMGITTYVAALYVSINTIVDILYAIADPRIATESDTLATRI
jgi:peptide/nickel transport system permease protein